MTTAPTTLRSRALTPRFSRAPRLALAAVLLAAGLTGGPSAAAQSAPSGSNAPLDFTVGEPGHEFTLSKARGSYVAIHVMLRTECPICQRTTQDYLRRADEVAGVRHIFLEPEATEAARDARLAAAGGDATRAANLPLYADPDGKVIAALNVPKGYAFHGVDSNFPALIIIDPTGTEVFRHVGKGTQDRYTFDRFAKKMTELTADAATREGLYEKGLAVNGYDVTAYFDSQALKGDEKITSSHRGVTYRFATPDRRARFAKEPEKYLPEYGGWCATAMAEGDKVEIDPKTYKITNGKLYLFYNGFLGNAKKDWDKDEPRLISMADGAWKTTVQKAAAKKK